MTKEKRRQSRAELTPLPESATTRTRCSGVGSSPATSGWRILIQTVAGPGSVKAPLMNLYSTAVW